MNTKIEYRPDLSAYFPYHVYYYSILHEKWIQNKTLNNLETAKEVAMELSRKAEDFQVVYFKDGEKICGDL
jgi:hypothetical protein